MKEDEGDSKNEGDEFQKLSLFVSSNCIPFETFKDEE